MSDLPTSLEALHAQCEDEVTRFHKEGERNSPACYELFVLALQSDNTLAFTLIYRIYEPLVKKWVLQHSSYSLTQQPVEHFVSAAYTSFYSTLRGKPLLNFPTVAQFLGYLKTCVHTAILQYLRTERKHRLDDELHESTPAHPIETTTSFDELWEHVCKLVTNEQDQLLMRCSFVEDRKPAEIAEIYPQHWPTPRAATIGLHRIRKLLRHDPVIRQMAGLNKNL